MTPWGTSDDEFQAIVNLVRRNPQVQADIERITGLSVDPGASPRTIFNNYRALEQATAVIKTVAAHGKAVNEVRTVAMEMDAQANVLSENEALRARCRQLEEQSKDLEKRNTALTREYEKVVAEPARAVDAKGTQRT